MTNLNNAAENLRQKTVKLQEAQARNGALLKEQRALNRLIEDLRESVEEATKALTAAALAKAN